MTTELPSWLELIQTTSVTSPNHGTTSPPAPATASPNPAGTSTSLSPYKELQFENLFEGALDRLSMGHQLTDICDDDPRGLNPVEFLKWIKKDKTRYDRFKESQELAAEFLIYGAIKAANGNDSMNDVNRDKLIVDTSLRIAAAWSPRKYGKDQGLSTGNTGGGGITINIGTVDSPYTKQTVEMVETVSTPVVEISDVEVK